MSSAEHERLLRRARAQDVALFRYRLIGPALEEGLTTKQRGRVVRGIAGQVRHMVLSVSDIYSLSDCGLVILHI